MAVSAVLMLSACGDGGSPSRPTVSSAPSAITATSVELAPSTQGYDSALDPETGDAENGSSWSFGVPQIGGGEKEVRDSFNGAMSKAADELMTRAGKERMTLSDGSLGGERSRVDIAPSTLSGVLIVQSSGESSGMDVATTVVEAGSGKQLTFDDIFLDPSAATVRLRTLLRNADRSGRLGAATIDRSSLKRWVAVEQGLHVYVPVDQANGGFVPVTVAWDSVADLLNSTGKLYFLNG